MDATTTPSNRVGRRYRSKKQRPCDLCRTRKIQCKLQSQETVCELCRRLSRQCSYVLGPARRREQPRPGSGGNRMEQPPFNNVPFHEEQLSQPFNVFDPSGFNGDLALLEQWPTTTHPLLGGPFPEADGTNMTGDYNMGVSLGSLPELMPTSQFELRPSSQHTVPSTSSASPCDRAAPHTLAVARSPASSRDASQRALWPTEYSLEAKRGYSNQLIGLSCESDPFLLRHYKYDALDNYHMFRLDFRRVTGKARMLPAPPLEADAESHAGHTTATNVPVQFMMCDETIWSDDLKATERMLSRSGEGTEAADMALLHKIVDVQLGKKLIKLYSRFVHPRYPVLSPSDLRHMLSKDNRQAVSIGIQSAVFALAAPFTFLDDELSVSNGYGGVPTDELWDIAQRSFHRSSCFTHLSLLQLCLLLLNKPPENFVVAEPVKYWALSCTSVAIAETLGVNVEPKDWRIPREEVMLRRRLWWLMYVGHTWHALVCGRSSHINDTNWSVSPLHEEDFETSEAGSAEVGIFTRQQIPLCLAQSELAVIAADILREFYSVRAIAEPVVLTTLLARAQPLRTRIETWRQSHHPLLSTQAADSTKDDFGSGAFLRLQHLTLEIMILRALLRPLSNEAMPAEEKSLEPVSTIFENCAVCVTVAKEIVSSLGAKDFAQFWPHYTRFQICYVSTLLLLTLAQSGTGDIAIRNKELLDEWRDTLRMQARAWPLARLAAMRLDASFWKGIPSVIHGAGADSPALKLFEELASARQAQEDNGD
ncbi:uncharacterized protein B0I36DRAFT_250687 [Microdochium trichocladiopsis]|uniref:Zn(2)-C6 fungal-type domain-containing protein n=1 Tax=Microdochium trichocladiopsis TaxID=1682393 RepID=A0A9P9BJ28_9PEZI|nr:uncharacterized protein B0I36DRAFT_250687 [Microdochium trichocladiopsis]KAH7024848.1 hypothetical protein B0I36DRAFT_250687 [Microdochium trichocladiopsis]